MKKSEIVKGECYEAKVNDRIVTVRVDVIRDVVTGPPSKLRESTFYDVTNLATGRKTTFRSAQKFRGRAADPAKVRVIAEPDRKTQLEGRAADGILTRSEAKELERAKEAPATVPFPRSQPTPETSSPAAAPSAEPTAEPSTPSDGDSPLANLLRASIVKEECDRSPHVIVEARAGTGKTTTLIEGLKRVKGLPTTITPSPQQAAVWEQMEKSRGAKTICFTAFNHSIAAELKGRVPPGCNAMTMHSMGNEAVRKAFGRLEADDYNTYELVAEIVGRDLRQLRHHEPVLLQATKQLVGLCKKNLCRPTPYPAERVCLGTGGHQAMLERWDWVKQLDDLCAHYDVDTNGVQGRVYELVPQVLGRCKSPKGKIDFDDMIWLPIVLGLPVFQYDLLLVDEAQDLNRCQQALARKAGKRLILVGDPRQAIYGFAGADAESMPRMAAQLGETERGCVTLPLTVTRRCGKAIVEEARKIVPDFEAHESNGEGRIGQARYGKNSGGGTALPTGQETYDSQVQDGDFILCRVNAPLVSQCFRFLRAGRKANIQGRDVGQGLVSTIRKLKAISVPDLVGKLSDWLHKETANEQAKRNPSEARLIALQDRHDCLVCFTEGQDTVEGVVAKIGSVFTDDKVSPGIKLSSIHKAKGLEAKRVFLLQIEGASVPHPMAKSAWQRGQEMNLLYVATTRAIEELVYVS